MLITFVCFFALLVFGISEETKLKTLNRALQKTLDELQVGADSWKGLCQPGSPPKQNEKTNVDLQACKDQCKSDSSCNGIAYHSKARICYPYSGDLSVWTGSTHQLYTCYRVNVEALETETNYYTVPSSCYNRMKNGIPIRVAKGPADSDGFQEFEARYVCRSGDVMVSPDLCCPQGPVKYKKTSHIVCTVDDSCANCPGGTSRDNCFQELNGGVDLFDKHFGR